MPRKFKQLIIGLVYLGLFVALLWVVYDISTPDPSCTDAIQNQSEEGVDCGIVCGVLCIPAPVAPQVVSVDLVTVASGDYDVIARVANPNSLYGSAHVGYRIDIATPDGHVIASVPGSFYIAPAQTKYLVRSALKAPAGAVSASLAVTDADWHEISANGPRVDFSVRRETWSEPGLSGAAVQFEGTVFNDSDFDFNTVDVAVAAFDAAGKVLAVNATELYTFGSRTERYFKVVWPTAFAGVPARTVVQASADIFSNENFIRRYGSQERFQQYYESR